MRRQTNGGIGRQELGRGVEDGVSLRKPGEREKKVLGRKFIFVLFDTEAHYVAKTGFKLVILASLFSEC